MTLDELLASLEARSVTVKLTAADRPVLAGNTTAVTADDRSWLGAYRWEIIDRLRKPTRRLVLLDADGKIEAVLAQSLDFDPPLLEARMQELAAAHPGRRLAAEWYGPLGWTRWLTFLEDRQ